MTKKSDLTILNGKLKSTSDTVFIRHHLSIFLWSKKRIIIAVNLLSCNQEINFEK